LRQREAEIRQQIRPLPAAVGCSEAPTRMDDIDIAPVIRGRLASISIIALLLCPCSLPAQQPAAAFSYEGQPVAAVQLVASPTVDLRPLQHLVKLRSHEPYTRAKAEATASALRSAGHFSRVDIQMNPEANGLQVTFLLQPVYYVGIISFRGRVNGFDYARLLNVVNHPSNTPYERDLTQAGEDALKGFFSNEGYFLAQVHEETQLDNAHRLANLVYNVTLGKRAKFGTVRVLGPPTPEARSIQGTLRSVRARIKGGDIKPGRAYHPAKVQAAVRVIRDYLGRREWLASQISIPRPQYDPKTNRVPVRFQVELGPKVRIRLTGARIRGKMLKTLIPIYQQNTFDRYLVAEGAQNLARYFRSKGYFDVRVDPKVEKTLSLIALTYQIERGDRHNVMSITFAGNRYFKEAALRPLVVVQTAHFLSHGKFGDAALNQSVTNLTGFYQNAGFENVRVHAAVKDIEPKIYVTFHIQEGPQTIVNTVTVTGLETQTLATLAPSGLKVRDGQPFSPASVTVDRKRIIASYLNLGYPDASFRATSSRVPKEPHRISIKYSINEGPHVTIRSVLILGDQHTKPAYIRRNIGIDAGQPLSEGNMLQAESTLYNLGLFDWASVGPSNLIGQDPLTASAGGLDAIPVTSQTQLAALNQVDPLADVLVRVHENKRNEVSYGVGFLSTPRTGQISTGVLQLPGLPTVGLPKSFQLHEKTIISPEGSLQYSRENLFGTNQTASVSTVLSRLDQRFTVSYSDPQFFSSSWSSIVSASTERTTQNPLFTARLGQGSLEFDHPLNSARTERLELRYSYQATALSSLLVRNFIPTEDQSIRDSTLSASFIRDTRDNPMDAHRGVFENIDLGITPKLLGSSQNFARFFGQAATYRQVKPWLVWANRIQLGEEKALVGSHVPFSDRFFTGGADSLRGFAINSAGPQVLACFLTSTNEKRCVGTAYVPTGGPQLFIVNSEGRFPIPIDFPVIHRLGGVLFYDGGNVFSRIGLTHDGEYSNTVGFGLRYQTPVGPIRLDLGENLNPTPGFKGFQYFITLGQAF
jgi:outer membrane protein insertion porin family